MSESDELSIAFQKVRKFDNYRFLRSWGLTIIVFGIFSLVTDTRLAQNFILNLLIPEANGISDFVSLFFNILMIVVLFAVILHTYLSVKIISVENSRVITANNVRLGLAMIVMYLISPRILTFFILDLWAFIIATFCIRLSEVIGAFMAYLILRNSMKSHNFKEVLYLTLIFTFFMMMDAILMISTFFLMPNILWIFFFILLSFGMTTCFAICYIITGRYSLKKAQIILQL
ncbi:MAG: hypothetical protein ACFFB2_15885 [Promethearchaeota archaeon]